MLYRSNSIAEKLKQREVACFDHPAVAFSPNLALIGQFLGNMVYVGRQPFSELSKT